MILKKTNKYRFSALLMYPILTEILDYASQKYVGANYVELVFILFFLKKHGVQRRMISVDIFFVFLRLLFFALWLLYVT